MSAFNTKEIEKGIKQILKTGHGYGPEFRKTLKTTQDILRKINKEKRTTAHNYFELAQCFINLEDTQLALQSLKAALIKSPHHVESLCLLVALLESVGQLRDASLVLDDLLALDPENIQVNCQKAELLFRMKNFIEAIQYATKAAKGDTINVPALIILGSCFNELCEYEHAIKFLQVAYYAEQQSTELFYQLGQAFHRSNNVTKALEMFNRGLEIDPDHYELNMAVFKGYLEIGEHDKLRHYLAKGISRQRHAYQSLFYLGFYYAAVKKDHKALHYYQRLLKIRPDDQTTRLNMAHIYQARGEYDKAIPIYEDVLEKDPDAAQASINLGLLKISQGDLEQGFKIFNNRFANQRFKYKQLNWNGESLSGKKVLLRKEQGIGDQIETAWFFQWLQQEEVEATVQVDARLIPILKRSFPKFDYVTFSDEYINSFDVNEYDFQILQKSLGILYHQKIKDAVQQKRFSEEGYLKVKPELLDYWKSKVVEQSNRKTVGIAWRSGYINRTRSNYYLTVAEICELFKELDVNLVNLQYSYNEAEIDYLKEHLGERFIHFEELDLKDDQEGLAALIKSLDMVFTAPTAVYDLCGAVGKRTLCYSYAHNSLSAMMYGQKSNPMFPDIEMVWSVDKAVNQSLDLIREKLVQHINELDK